MSSNIECPTNQGRQDLDHLHISNLNAALRILRRLPRDLIIYSIAFIFIVMIFSKMSTYLAPPYGLYFLGQGLVTWGLIFMLLVLGGYIWWRGRQLGDLLGDPHLISSPFTSLLSAPAILAEQAMALNMEWTGFFGPLRPRK